MFYKPQEPEPAGSAKEISKPSPQVSPLASATANSQAAITSASPRRSSEKSGSAVAATDAPGGGRPFHGTADGGSASALENPGVHALPLAAAAAASGGGLSSRIAAGGPAPKESRVCEPASDTLAGPKPGGCSSSSSSDQETGAHVGECLFLAVVRTGVYRWTGWKADASCERVAVSFIKTFAMYACIEADLQCEPCCIVRTLGQMPLELHAYCIN